MTDINTMLDDCNSAAPVTEENGGPGFTQWELEFLDSIEDQYADRGELSLRQEETLRKIWNKI